MIGGLPSTSLQGCLVHPESRALPLPGGLLFSLAPDWQHAPAGALKGGARTLLDDRDRDRDHHDGDRRDDGSYWRDGGWCAPAL